MSSLINNENVIFRSSLLTNCFENYNNLTRKFNFEIDRTLLIKKIDNYYELIKFDYSGSMVVVFILYRKESKILKFTLVKNRKWEIINQDLFQGRLKNSSFLYNEIRNRIRNKK